MSGISGRKIRGYAAGLNAGHSQVTLDNPVAFLAPFHPRADADAPAQQEASPEEATGRLGGTSGERGGAWRAHVG